jgi:hypothetical protein
VTEDISHEIIEGSGRKGERSCKWVTEEVLGRAARGRDQINLAAKDGMSGCCYCSECRTRYRLRSISTAMALKEPHERQFTAGSWWRYRARSGVVIYHRRACEAGSRR